MKDLAVQIRRINDITVDQSKRADSSSGKICCGRAPEPSKADDQYRGPLDSKLTYQAESAYLTCLPKDDIGSMPTLQSNFLQDHLPSISPVLSLL